MSSGLEECADRGVQRVTVEALEQTPDGGRVWRGPYPGERVRRKTEQAQDRLRGVIDPLVDRDQGARTGQNRWPSRTAVGAADTSVLSGRADPVSISRAPQVSGILQGDLRVRKGQFPQPGGHGR